MEAYFEKNKIPNQTRSKIKEFYHFFQEDK